MEVVVGDLMSSELVTLAEHESLDLADEIMKLARIRHLPVVNNNRLVGLVTHRDLLRAQVSSLTELSDEEREELAGAGDAEAIDVALEDILGDIEVAMVEPEGGVEGGETQRVIGVFAGVQIQGLAGQVVAKYDGIVPLGKPA